MMKRLMMASAALVMGFSAVTSHAEEAPPAKYNMYCVACHSTGAAGAPKTHDKAAWDARLATVDGKIDGLVAVAKKGLNAMPPMGLCMDCSDAELKSIVEFMSK